MTTVPTGVAGSRIRDLRQRAPYRLALPAGSVLLVAGVPGAGKTTLLRRLYALSGRERQPVRTGDGTLVLDSEQSRNWWSTWLRQVPYAWWRPLVHLTHLIRLRTALRGGGSIVLHECGTRRWLFTALVRQAARRDREVHVVLLDVPPPVAKAGGRERGREVRSTSFARHVRRWRRLMAGAEERRADLLPGAHSVIVLDRASTSRLADITFTVAPVDAGVVELPGADVDQHLADRAVLDGGVRVGRPLQREVV